MKVYLSPSKINLSEIELVEFLSDSDIQCTIGNQEHPEINDLIYIETEAEEDMFRLSWCLGQLTFFNNMQSNLVNNPELFTDLKTSIEIYKKLLKNYKVNDNDPLTYLNLKNYGSCLL